MARTSTKEPTAEEISAVETVKKDSEPVATEKSGGEVKSGGKHKVISKRFAGKAVYGPEGIVVFNQDGVADISEVEAQHFSKIPGFEVK